MRDEGKAAFYSNDLDELMARYDAMTVLRDGKLIATLDKEDLPPMPSALHGRPRHERKCYEDNERSHQKPWFWMLTVTTAAACSSIFPAASSR